MKCPNCGSRMEMYERFWDYDDNETLIGEEHFYCPNCFKSWNRDVTYSLVKEGELTE